MQRNDPPRWTRFFTPGSPGSNDVAGPCGLRATLPVAASSRVVVGAIPVAHPLPDVPGHVIEAVAVRRKLRDRRDARERVRAGVVIGKVPLMRVRHPLAALAELIAPRKELPGQAAARRKLPFRFGRQTLAGPLRIRQRIRVRDVHDGKALLPLDRALRTERMAPARAVDVRPPLIRIGERNGMVGRGKDHRAGHEGLGRRAGKVLGARRLARRR